MIFFSLPLPKNLFDVLTIINVIKHNQIKKLFTEKNLHHEQHHHNFDNFHTFIHANRQPAYVPALDATFLLHLFVKLILTINNSRIKDFDRFPESRTQAFASR